MSEIPINPLFNYSDEYKRPMIINPYRFGGGGGLWTPQNDPNGLCWLDGTDESTMIKSGDEVTQWTDKLGSYDFTRVSTYGPDSGLSTRNGKNFVEFDDLNSEGLANALFVSGGGDLMIIFVGNHLSSHVLYGSIFSMNGPANDFQFGRIANEGGYFLASGICSSFGLGLAGDTGWHVWTVILDSTNSLVRLRLDGDIANEVTATLNNDIDTPVDFGLMVNRADNYFAEGGVMHVVVSTDVSTANTQRAEGFAAHDAGITASLPAAHPYKSAAPTT